ncbi:rod-binding protein [Magnetospirillum sp. UT-4]|uniref:rod-binding protein n=1 Tax=Magnetospirillum sp. UT-4 TaxID=2681467 RepID=UPI001383BEDF|nr:rod-binding protein [Magnetospirillum sp. UT-4]CAA7618592.1 putative flagellar protein FlgJ, N-terminal [Magnetospirillum sp. UT-4]
MDAATTQLDQAQNALLAPKQVAPKVSDPQQAREVAKKFEAMFVTQMMQHMFTGVDENGGMFGGGHAEAMFRPLLLEEYGKMVAARGNGIGLADQVTRALLANQEV